MINIRHVKDLSGNYQALEFINLLMDEAEKYKDILITLRQLLRILPKAVHFPMGEWEEEFLELSSYDENIEEGLENLYEPFLECSLKPLKIYGNPKTHIYEIKIDNKKTGDYFRLIYFPYTLNGEQYYCLVKAFIKRWNPPSDNTREYFDEVYELYKLIRKDENILQSQLSA